jgi:hypothetical protein
MNTDAPLAGSVAFEGLEPIAGRGVEFFHAGDAMNLPQFPKGNPLECGVAPAVTMAEYFFGFLIGEGADHA